MYMYYVRHQFPVELVPQNSTDPYETILDSFNTVYSSLAGGPLDEHSIVLDWPLDCMFGIVIIIILLNVVIAVVDGAWQDAEEEADQAFWHYRLELILEKTRGGYEDDVFLSSCFDNLGGLDEFYHDNTTAGTTMVDVRRKLALARKKEGVLYCFVIIVKS